MKAKIEPRINLDNRTRLENVIPLSTPFILFVDPSSICNFRCKFCPTGHRDLIKERFNGNMDFDIYKKIINDLKIFDKKLKVLRLYKEGEPLLNRNFANMVKYAKDSGYVEYVDTTTNGYFLNYDLGEKILCAGLDKINISVNGLSNETFLKFTGVKIDFDKYIDNIKKFYKLRESGKYNCEICIKITGDFLTEDEKIMFYETFGDYTDRIFIENISPCWPEFDVEDNTKINISKTNGIYGQSINNETEIVVCPYIFYSTTINSDGTVSLCFLDWAHKLITGDVNKQSLKEIWDGDLLHNYQIENLNGRRKKNDVCMNCGQLKYCMPDNIDPYIKDILLRMTR